MWGCGRSIIINNSESGVRTSKADVLIQMMHWWGKKTKVSFIDYSTMSLNSCSSPSVGGGLSRSAIDIACRKALIQLRRLRSTSPVVALVYWPGICFFFFSFFLKKNLTFTYELAQSLVVLDRNHRRHRIRPIVFLERA